VRAMHLYGPNYKSAIALETSGRLFQGWGGGNLGNVSGTAMDARPPGTGIYAVLGFPDLSTMICTSGWPVAGLMKSTHQLPRFV
jgi:hypothetical protein